MCNDLFVMLHACACTPLCVYVPSKGCATEPRQLVYPFTPILSRLQMAIVSIVFYRLAASPLWSLHSQLQNGPLSSYYFTTWPLSIFQFPSPHLIDRRSPHYNINWIWSKGVPWSQSTPHPPPYPFLLCQLLFFSSLRLVPFWSLYIKGWMLFLTCTNKN